MAPVHRPLSCGNISWRLGRLAAPSEIRAGLANLHVRDNVLETCDRTLQHLAENQVDPEKTRLTFGLGLTIDSSVRPSWIIHRPTPS